MKFKCETCPYWDETTENIAPAPNGAKPPRMGRCRYDPVKVQLIPGMQKHPITQQMTQTLHIQPYFPTSTADDFCGKHPEFAAYVEKKYSVPEYSPDQYGNNAGFSAVPPLQVALGYVDVEQLQAIYNAAALHLDRETLDFIESVAKDRGITLSDIVLREAPGT